MTLNRVTNFLRDARVWSTGVGAIVLFLVMLGFDFKTPARLMAEHENRQARVDEVQDQRIDAVRRDVAELRGDYRNQVEMMEGLMRSECIRETLENLQRSGNVTKCRELGIEK